MPTQVQSKIVSVASLSPSDLHEMYDLFAKYYDSVSFEKFRQDLAEKTHVFTYKDEQGWVGFSSIFRKKNVNGLTGTFLFSGDTVIRESHWGSKLLQMSFFHYIVQSKFLSPGSPVYWMLISKGFKTYLMMRRNFSESYPSPSLQTPVHLKKIMDGFYSNKFGIAYRPEQGLVEFEESLGAVKGEIAAPKAGDLLDPDVSHFLKLNPRYAEGVELACITEIRFSDFLKHIPKYFLGPWAGFRKKKAAR